MKVSYHGYIPHVKKYLSSLKTTPRVLEVGIDRGVSLLPLVTFLAPRGPFVYIGVDVLVQEQLALTLKLMGSPMADFTYLLQGNSLDVLPTFIEQKMKFDVVLLDGDHNYYTVSKEMPMVGELLDDSGILIVDDYNGKWSERDLWYAERSGYEDNEFVTKKVEDPDTKHGVKPAVDEWLAAHPEYVGASPIQGEPIVIQKR